MPKKPFTIRSFSNLNRVKSKSTDIEKERITQNINYPYLPYQALQTRRNLQRLKYT